MTYIDFSAGDNRFARLLPCHTKYSFDIDPIPASLPLTQQAPPNQASEYQQPITHDAKYHDVYKKDWLQVTKSHDTPMVDESHLIIGLNPPFGKQGATARKFVYHAINQYRPMYLVLILPRMSIKRLDQEYDKVHSQALEDDSFFEPCSSKYGALPEHKCKTFRWPTSLFIYRRKPEHATLSCKSTIQHVKNDTAVYKKLSRKLNLDDAPLLILRRAGRNAGKQCYVIQGGSASTKITYIDRDKVTFYDTKMDQQQHLWKMNRHSVHSETFLKIYLREDCDPCLVAKFLVDRCPNDIRKSSATPFLTNKFVQDVLHSYKSTI